MSAHYRIQVAAEMSGVSPLLIRAWERRYGVLEPKRTESGYRTYSQLDIEVLRRLRELTDEGLAISQAAALLPAIRLELQDSPPIKQPVDAQLERWQALVLQAAKRLDQATVERTLDEAYRSMAPVNFYEELIATLMREVGDRWHAKTLSVMEEHLISAVVREKLVTLFAKAPRRSKGHVVCACPPEEAHDFGLLGAGLRFRHAGWKVTLLGAKTPIDQLIHVVETLSPDLVAISLVGTHGAREFLNEISAKLPKRKSVVLGGQAANALAEHFDFRLVKTDADWKRILRRSK